MKYLRLFGNLFFLFIMTMMTPHLASAQGEVQSCSQCPSGTTCKITRDGDNTKVLQCVPEQAAPAKSASRGSTNLPPGYECMPPSVTCPEGYVGRLSANGCGCLSSGGSPSGNSDSNNSGGGMDCNAEYMKMKQQCDLELSDTASYCDEKKNADMSEVSTQGSQLALMMGQQTAASIQAACSKMADFSQAANAALAAYRLACSNALSNCRSACQGLMEIASSCQSNPGFSAGALSDAQSARARCDQYQSKVNEAQAAIQNFGITAMQASQCAALTSGTGLTEFCRTNPTHVSCSKVGSVNCADPVEAAKNKVCICSTNPNDPACSGSQNVGGGASGIAGGNTDLQSRLLNKNSAGDLGVDIPNLPGIAQGKPGSGGSGEAVDGSQGGGTVGGGSGGSGSSGGGAGGGSAESGTDTNVNGGFYGGGGGRGIFGSGSSRGTAGGGGSGGYASAGGNNAQGPDLRKFLPGGQFDPRRGISGTGGPDGITGPNSNIWQKIQNRYRVMSPSLLP